MSFISFSYAEFSIGALDFLLYFGSIYPHQFIRYGQFSRLFLSVFISDLFLYSYLYKYMQLVLVCCEFFCVFFPFRCHLSLIWLSSVTLLYFAFDGFDSVLFSSTRILDVWFGCVHQCFDHSCFICFFCIYFEANIIEGKLCLCQSLVQVQSMEQIRVLVIKILNWYWYWTAANLSKVLNFCIL